jgi:hypothetical protein
MAKKRKGSKGYTLDPGRRAYKPLIRSRGPTGSTLDPGQRAWGTFREETLGFWQKELNKLDSLKHKPNPLRKKK